MGVSTVRTPRVTDRQIEATFWRMDCMGSFAAPSSIAELLGTINGRLLSENPVSPPLSMVMLTSLMESLLFGSLAHLETLRSLG